MKRILLLLFTAAVVLSLCACGRKKQEPEPEKVVTLDAVFSTMVNSGPELCIEMLENMEGDSEAEGWLSFKTAVQEDRFDDAKAVFSDLTAEWNAEMLSMTGTRIIGLSRFVSRLCGKCGIADFRYLCLIERACRENTGITDIMDLETRSGHTLDDLCNFGPMGSRVTREAYDELIGQCGTNPNGGVLIVADKDGDEVQLWTGLMAAMPDGYFSYEPANIEYLLVIKQDVSHQGTYDNNTEAFMRRCSINLTRIGTEETLYSQSLDVHTAPKSTGRTPYDTYGSPYKMKEIEPFLYEAISELLGYETDGYRFLPLTDGSVMCLSYGGEDSEIVIPTAVQGITVTAIGEQFAKRSGITERLLSVKIPDTVRRIGDYAFSHCYQLERVYMPAEIEYVGNGVFTGDYLLTRIELPDCCAFIGGEAFSGTGITELRIPMSLDKICFSAFSYCNITKLEIPGTVKIVGNSAFEKCPDLESVTIAEGCEEIGWNAFGKCHKLRDVTIPSSVLIDDSAFDGCENLEKVE